VGETNDLLPVMVGAPRGALLGFGWEKTKIKRAFGGMGKKNRLGIQWGSSGKKDALPGEFEVSPRQRF